MTNSADVRRRLITATEVSKLLSGHESVSAKELKQADPLEQAALIAGLNNALAEIQAAEKDPRILSSPNNRMAALLQSYLAEKSVAAKKEVQPLPGDALEVKFDSKDWLGWAKSFFTWVGRLKPHRWLRASPNPDKFLDTARIALLGDWGTGLYGAPDCAKSIEREGDSCTHLIHLGDVYYSGTRKEIQDRFLALWPSLPKATHRACNSNHEMYSGGNAYFDVTLSAFQQPASYFAFQNKYWLLVGLDSAYKDHNLTDDQLGWLTALVQKVPDKKLVLFSHHQPYSILDSQGPNLIRYLRKLLDEGRIFAWYWGHEHRCVIYEKHPVWKLRGRCIGHGGYPYFRDDLSAYGKEAGANDSTWYRLKERALDEGKSGVAGGLAIPEAIIFDGPNAYMDDLREKYGPNGYVMLDFEGDRMFETFYVPLKDQNRSQIVVDRRPLER